MYPGGDFACAGMRRAAAWICESEGLSHAEDGAFEILVSALAQYIETVGGQAQQLAELGGRAQADLRDLRAALQHCEPKFGPATCDDSLNAEDLPDNAEDCFGSELPAFPVVSSILEPWYALAAEDLQHSQQPHEAHIPAFLPPFPPTWRLLGPKDVAKSRDATNYASVHDRDAAVAALMQLTDDFMDPVESEDGQISRAQSPHHAVSQWHVNAPDSKQPVHPLHLASFSIGETGKSKPNKTVAEDIARSAVAVQHPTLAMLPVKTTESKEIAREKSSQSAHSTMAAEVAGSQQRIAASSTSGQTSGVRRSLKVGGLTTATPPATRRSTKAASAEVPTPNMQSHTPPIRLEHETAMKHINSIDGPQTGSASLVALPLVPPSDVVGVEQRGTMTAAAATAAAAAAAAPAAATVAAEVTVMEASVGTMTQPPVAAAATSARPPSRSPPSARSVGTARPPAGSPQQKKPNKKLRVL